MSKVCEICGRGKMAGKNVSFSNKKSNRTYELNLQKTIVEVDGQEKTVAGYNVQISNALYTEADIEFNGLAEVKETNAGTYNMGLVEANFENASTNFTNVKFVVVDGILEITKREIMHYCPDISETTVEIALRELKNAGKIEKIGGGRYTRYKYRRT